MTKRNFYEAMINYATSGDAYFVDADGAEVTVTAEDIQAFAENEIALLDKKAVKAKERAAKAKAEGDALYEAVCEVLTDVPQTIADVAAQIEGDDVSVAKVTYRLTKAVKDGKAVKVEVKVPNADGKETKKSAYQLA